MSVIRLHLGAVSEQVYETEGISKRLSVFFRRQLETEITAKQRLFDWIFGVIMPAVCFAFDPIFSRDGIARQALLGAYRPFIYLLSFSLIMATAAVLLFGNKLKNFQVFLSGLFAVGGIVALAIGIALLPLSLIGVVFIIGILGLTPLLTSFVYLRNAGRAFDTADPFLRPSALAGAFFLSAVLSVTIPMIVNVKIQALLKEMKTGDVATIQMNTRQLKYAASLANFNTLAGNYCGSPESENQTALAAAYLELTGGNIEAADYVICNDF